MKTTAKILAVAVLSCLAAAPALAEGFYGAIDAGNTHAADVCTGRAAIGCTGGATAFRIAGGYQFQPAWAAEISYAKYGSASLGVTAGGPRGDWSASGLQISAIASLPVNAQLSLFTKVGIGMNSYSAGGASASNNTLTGGIGVRYNISSQFAVRGQYENLGTFGDPATTGLTRVSLFTVGAVMNFQ
jgi:opacity protein-like surface antigen